MAEDFIAELPSVALVDHMEMVDVQNDRVRGYIGMERVELVGVVIKELPVVQAR